jgi:hypothetical protein
MVSSRLTCVVLSGGYLARFKLTRVCTTLSDMSDTCPLQSFSSSSTFIMLYLYHEMDVYNLIVGELINISKLFDYNCMISIGCKLMMLTT